MKHIGRVTKALPATAYVVPRNLFDILSWTDIIVVSGLTLEKFFRFWFGTLLPEGLLGDRNGNGVIDGQP
jgi:hypothetical protein